MGKLNYSARRIEGTKAGGVVSKDLKKRITPGSGLKAAARDPAIEVDITGKELTDEGFACFIDDLIQCIKYRDADHPEGAAKLTELHLRGNQLTLASLPKLGEVISLSTGDLRELDISHNKIEIVTPEHKAVWQRFLESFADCYVMKKLDIGSNPIGRGGMEMLARVYIQSDLDFVEEDDVSSGAGSKGGSDDGVDEVVLVPTNGKKENDAPQKEQLKKSPSKVKGSRRSGRSHSLSAAGKTITQADMKRFACTRGLRSIPFLILSDLSLTNGGGIHLASIITMHRPREQLLDFLPAGKALTLPDTVDTCKGVIWQPNDGMGPLGQKLLELAETIREQNSSTELDDDDLDEEEQLANSFEQLGASENDDANEKLDITARRKQRAKLNLEYTRLCKRVRIEALKAEWVHSAEIWSIALKMMTKSRAILLDDTDRAVEAPEEGEKEEALVPEVEKQPVEEKPETQYELIVPDGPLGPMYLVPRRPLGPFQPGAETFEENFPALQGGAGHKETPNQTPKEEKSSPSPQNARSEKVHARTLSALAKVQGPKMRFGLPLEVWRRIISDAVGANGILDVQQQISIIKYAADWDIVAYEQTIRGAEEHQQIWKFLDTVGCFTYSPLS